MQGAAKYTSGGHDSASIQGVIPSLSASFKPAGQSIVVNINGAQVSFTLDKKGRGRNAQGSIALKLKTSKAKKGKAQFASGNTPFAAKIQHGTWAGVWGLNPSTNMTKAPMQLAATITLGGNSYATVVTVTCTAKASVGAKFKK